MALDQATIAKLYAKKEELVAEQKQFYAKVGPLRSIDSTKKTVRCCSRRCMTTAYWTVKGVPYCNIHAGYAMNQLVVELSGGEDANSDFDKLPGYPSPIDVMELLDILYDVYHQTQEAYDYIERIEKVMKETGYPNLRRQYDVFNELKEQRVSGASS